MQPMIIRLGLLVLIVGCGIGLYAVVDTAQALPLRQAQASALDRFGADVLNMCQNATSTRDGSLPATVKIAVVNRDTDTIYDEYDQVLPSKLKATDKSDVTVLLCLTETKRILHTDEYGNPTKYTCTRYVRDLTGYLIDVRTGAAISHRSFDGQTPPACPDETDSDITRTGDIPLASDITAWLTGSIDQSA